MIARKKVLHLESDLMDAAQMARVTVEYIGQVLGMDDPEIRALSPEESSQLAFVVLQTCLMIEKARDTFFEQAGA